MHSFGVWVFGLILYHETFLKTEVVLRGYAVFHPWLFSNLFHSPNSLGH